MYSFDSFVRYSEVGEDKKLTLDGIINYFQDCSTFQSEELQVGVERLEALQRVWVLSSWQIVIDRYPALCEKIRISTWPYQFQGFLGWRNFTMTDGDGKLLAWANSLWTFLDTQTGRPARVPEEIEKAYTLEEKLDMEYASRKVPMPAEGKAGEPFSVQKHHLDTNHHVNNCQYIRMAADHLPEDFKVGQLRAEYKRQAVLDNVIIPEVYMTENKEAVVLNAEDKEPYAVVEFTK